MRYNLIRQRRAAILQYCGPCRLYNETDAEATRGREECNYYAVCLADTQFYNLLRCEFAARANSRHWLEPMLLACAMPAYQELDDVIL